MVAKLSRLLFVQVLYLTIGCSTCNFTDNICILSLKC